MRLVQVVQLVQAFLDKFPLCVFCPRFGPCPLL